MKRRWCRDQCPPCPRYGIRPENVIVYGQSIGTVPSVDLAARYESAAVVLHSPLTSGMRVAFPETKKTYCFDAFPKWVGPPTASAHSVSWQHAHDCCYVVSLVGWCMNEWISFFEEGQCTKNINLRKERCNVPGFSKLLFPTVVLGKIWK